MSQFYRKLGVWLGCGLLAVFLWSYLSPPGPENIGYSKFLQEVKQGHIRAVHLQGEAITGEYLGTDGKTHRFTTYAPGDNSLIGLLHENAVDIEVKPKQDASITQFLLSWAPVLLLIGLGVFFLRQMQSGASTALSFGKSRAQLLPEQQKKATFAEVAGADEAKEALQEIVDFLKAPQRFHQLGGRMTKGVLLTGPPGTGKTLLARAVAGEANVPFLSTTGSEFLEMFVGVGAARVRDLFERATKHAPCVVFIDELDAVGRQRGAGLGGGHDEREQTLNQLMTEMDGFESHTGVIVIAATNRVDILDRALIRAGRFDRKIPVRLPPLPVRKEILQIHIRNRQVPLAADVDLHEMAVRSATLSGADLSALVNQAAILAARHNRTQVLQEDFEHAFQRIGHRLPDATSPDELYDAVKHWVVGQSTAARMLAHALSMHYRDIRTAGDSIGARQPSKPNVLFYGPSGCGKTWIVESFAKQLQVPFASFDVTSLLYDPRSFPIALRRLVESAENNERRASLGVMCLYGLERLLALKTPSIQEELARIIEGARFDVSVSEVYADRSTYSVHTAQILFVGETTIIPDERSLSERLKEGAVGPFAQGTREFHYSYLHQQGMASRLLDMFPLIAAADRLDGEDLQRVLKLSNNGSTGAQGHTTGGQVVSLIEQYQRRFKDAKMALDFEPEAVAAMAEHTASLGGNARFLAAALEQVMQTHCQVLTGSSVMVTRAMVEAALAGRR